MAQLTLLLWLASAAVASGACAFPTEEELAREEELEEAELAAGDKSLGTSPRLHKLEMLATSPFRNSSVRMGDGEGMAYVGPNDALWLADDNGNAIYAMNRATGTLIQHLPQSAFISVRQAGGGARSVQTQAGDFEAIAYNTSRDNLFVFSGTCCPNDAAVYRLTRANISAPFRVKSYRPLTRDLSGVAYHRGEDRIYVAEGSVVREYSYGANRVFGGVTFPGVRKIFGMGFDHGGNTLWVVTGRNQLFRINWNTKKVVPGYPLDLDGDYGIADPRAVDDVGGRLHILDGQNYPGSPAKEYAVTVFAVE